MPRVNSRSAPRMIVTNSSWYRSKTLASDFPITKLTRYSKLSLRPRNTAPVWGFVSAERVLRHTEAGSGLRPTILAEQVFILRWRSRRTPGAWASGAIADVLREFGFAGSRLYTAEEFFSSDLCRRDRMSDSLDRHAGQFGAGVRRRFARARRKSRSAYGYSRFSEVRRPTQFGGNRTPPTRKDGWHASRLHSN